MSRELAEELWTQLPASARQRVDDAIVRRRTVHAIKHMRDAFEADGRPVPDLAVCKDLLVVRMDHLADRIEPPPAQDVDTLAAKTAELPRSPVGFEAEWDGDSHGWMVVVYAVLADPPERVLTAVLRDRGGLDLRTEATGTGRLLGERFGVPFRFLDEDGPMPAGR
jgi:hypothetical protein